LLVDSDLSKEYFSKQISKKKIVVTGTPRFDKNWQKKIASVGDFDFNYKSLSKKHSFVTFAYESYLNKFDKKINQKLIRQLHDIMDVVSKFKNLIIIFKIHPKKNMPGYLDILKKYDKNKWIVSKNHLSKLSKISKIFLHHPFSATMLDSISLKTPTIEIWKELQLHQDPLDTYGKLKLLVAAKDKKILLNLFSKVLIKKNSKEFYVQYNNFRKIFSKHNESSVNIIIKKLRSLN
jgi:UDP-N-acetylglucosamine 2-epimerase